MRIQIRDLPQGHSQLDFKESASALDLADWVGHDGPVIVAIDAEHRGDQITLRGEATVDLKGTCGRCTEPATQSLVTELLFFSDLRGKEDPRDETALELEGSILYHDGIELLIQDPIREAIILEVPSVLVCREDCKGLCSECGENLNRATCNCSDERLDPRWGALKDLQKKKS
ncbi:MAG: DUF177 domain-containing protein [Candidatus Eisenbacteria bacterium]|uniref:DUF177 domain-containing protein n=1 Tax=Eiseniibacteriota bacterium TaxID=2212470 RepID=A0A7Y2ED66_UNCEI|nr:DUF177 domain-containing protein [Candidatus Eisenbacteria bacterium]